MPEFCRFKKEPEKYLVQLPHLYEKLRLHNQLEGYSDLGPVLGSFHCTVCCYVQ